MYKFESSDIVTNAENIQMDIILANKYVHNFNFLTNFKIRDNFL